MAHPHSLNRWRLEVARSWASIVTEEPSRVAHCLLCLRQQPLIIRNSLITARWSCFSSNYFFQKHHKEQLVTVWNVLFLKKSCPTLHGFKSDIKIAICLFLRLDFFCRIRIFWLELLLISPEIPKPHIWFDHKEQTVLRKFSQISSYITYTSMYMHVHTQAYLLHYKSWALPKKSMNNQRFWEAQGPYDEVIVLNSVLVRPLGNIKSSFGNSCLEKASPVAQQ